VENKIGISRNGAAWPAVALLLCIFGAQAALAAAGRAAMVHAANGNLAAFSGGVNANGASFAAASSGYGTDSQGFAAAYQGSARSGVAAAAGAGTADGAFAVNWTAGQTVSFGASFRLPTGFHTATQGQQLLLAWNSAPGVDGSTQQGGVMIDYSTNLAYLVTNTTSSGQTSQQILAGPFAIPVGKWFTLQVRQLLGAGTARSAVFVNGTKVVSSTAPNFSEQQIVQVGLGIVQLSGGAQNGAVSLKLDKAYAALYTGYVNPLQSDRYLVGRTDMGVDFCMTRNEPIRALGDGIVVGISPDWFLGQPYLWYQLLDGPDAGRYVYVAEQIRGLARVGALISAGQVVARYKRDGTCIETGWSAGNGATMAQATTGYHEGEVTKAGVAFARFLKSLGMRGRFEYATRRVGGAWSPRFQNPWTQGP
jgi:murein DD-endopeptidase MepM/ murein hydrolase activator NlpD